MTTKMLRKGRAAVEKPKPQRSRFHLAKAMVLANTNFKQRSGINSAASFLLDGHSVDLSEEFVEQKPSLIRSNEWDTYLTLPTSPSSSAGIIRVCWQCPEGSAKGPNRSTLASKLMD